ncbi:MAG TPA: single-stranded DNA-binding protein [Kiritimatiellia bacterium]|nr:single-stranded DNA-binding protein [Kiritimatiellia bacterium]
MASFNKVILMGNLTRDPELRHISSGTAVTELRLAINRQYRSGSGEDREEVVYVSVDVWGRQAETCGEYLKKGSPVMVEGRLKLDEWEKDGKKMSKLGVVAERVQFLGSPRRGAMADGPDDGGGAPSGSGGSSERGGFTGEDDEDIPF